MLDKVYEMIDYGILKDTNNLKELKNSHLQINDDLIIPYINNIQDDLKSYILGFNNDNVFSQGCLSGFSDKISSILFSLDLQRDALYEGAALKIEIPYGGAGSFYFGLNKSTCNFDLVERKLIMLINHYYISNYDEKYTEYFIPYDHLRLLFNNNNSRFINDKLEDAVLSLNSKRVFWNADNERLNKTKKFKSKGIATGRNEKLVDLQILYNPIIVKDKISYSILGISFKETNFMKFRYSIKNIWNHYSFDFLKCNDQEFDMLNYLYYRYIIYSFKNEQKKNYWINNKASNKYKKKVIDSIHNNYSKTFIELMNSLYTFINNKKVTVHYSLCYKPNKKRTLICFLKVLLNVASILKKDNILIGIYCEKKLVYDANNAQDEQDLLSKIESYIDSNYKFEDIYKLINNGSLTIKVHFKD